MKPITPRQKEVLDFIMQFHVAFDRPPTYQEISDEMGFTRKSAWDHIKALDKKGYIKRGTTAEGIKTIMMEDNNGEE